MADGGLTVFDGTHLRDVDPGLPESDDAITGAKILDIGESEASSTLFGLSLPENLKSGARKRINVDSDSFCSTELDREQALLKLKDYVNAIADELKDDPLVVSVLDGNTLRLFLEDEDDFAMLAENLFTDLDTEDKGKIGKNQIRNSLRNMGVEMGVPPFPEFPLLDDILKKHGAEGNEELGQAQFASLLQPILQELADALAIENVVVIQNLKIINGSKLRKFLADEKQLNDAVEQMLKFNCTGEDGKGSIEKIRGFLEKNGSQLSLPPSESNQAVVLLYDQIFSDIENVKRNEELERDQFQVVVKDLLGKLAEQLEANPIFHDLDS